MYERIGLPTLASLATIGWFTIGEIQPAAARSLPPTGKAIAPPQQIDSSTLLSSDSLNLEPIEFNPEAVSLPSDRAVLPEMTWRSPAAIELLGGFLPERKLSLSPPLSTPGFFLVLNRDRHRFIHASVSDRYLLSHYLSHYYQTSWFLDWPPATGKANRERRSSLTQLKLTEANVSLAQESFGLTLANENEAENFLFGEVIPSNAAIVPQSSSFIKTKRRGNGLASWYAPSFQKPLTETSL